MIVTLTLLATFSVLFYLVGSSMTSIFPKFGLDDSFGRLSLTGFAISLFLGTMWLRFELEIKLLLPTLTALAVLGVWPWFRRIKKFRMQQGTKLTGALSFFAGLPVILLHQSNVFASAFSYRTGPDSFGWATSTLTICEGSKLSDLISRVNVQLGETSISRSFIRFLNPGEKSIAQITSYNDQISSEFLVGANRTGIQGVLGSSCANFGQEFFAAMFVALAAWAFMQIFLQAKESISGKGSHPRIRLIVALIATLNVGTLSTALEGGYGQIATLPFFLLVLNSMNRKSYSFGGFLLSLVTLLVASIAAYTDVLYLAVPFIGAFFLWGMYNRQFHFGHFRIKEYLLIGAALSILLLFMDSLVPLIFGTFQNHPELAGWHQGKFMFPSNAFGIVSSLPVGNYIFPPRTFIGLAIDGIVSASFLYLLAQRPLAKNLIPILAFLGYLYLTYSVYVGVDFINNYRIWKYSGYAGIFVVFLYANIFDSVPKMRKPTISRNTVRATAAAALIVSTGVSSLAWSADWFESRKTTISYSEGQAIRELAKSYNILGGAGVNTLTLTIFGDIKFGAPLRGAGRVTPDPKLDFLVLVPSGFDCDSICMAQAFASRPTKPISSRIIFQSTNFDGHLVKNYLN